MPKDPLGAARHAPPAALSIKAQPAAAAVTPLIDTLISTGAKARRLCWKLIATARRMSPALRTTYRRLVGAGTAPRRCAETQEELARWLRCSERTVRRRLKELAALKLVERVDRRSLWAVPPPALRVAHVALLRPRRETLLSARLRPMRATLRRDYPEWNAKSAEARAAARKTAARDLAAWWAATAACSRRSLKRAAVLSFGASSRTASR